MGKVAKIRNICAALSGLCALLVLFLLKTDAPRHLVDLGVYVAFGLAAPAIVVVFIESYRQFR